MPQGNRTGPDGRGPMTGRRMGYCLGNDFPGCQNSGFGRGMRRCSGKSFGAGFGRASGRGFWTTPQEMTIMGEVSEKKLLEELKAEKKEIDKAIKDLEQKNKKNK